MMPLFERTLHCPVHRRYVVISCACLLLCLLVPLAGAADIGELQVRESKGYYRIELAKVYGKRALKLARDRA